MNSDASAPHAVVPLILSPAPMPPQSAASRGLRFGLPGRRTDRVAAVPMRLELGAFEGHIGPAGVVLPAAARVYVEFITKQ